MGQTKPRPQKLDAKKVRAIRVAYADGATCRELAAKFECSAGLITHVVCGRVWKSAGGPITRRYAARGANYAWVDPPRKYALQP